MGLNRKKIVVAVDGPAGSGKSTVCRDVAIKCGLKYIDSGALYRSVTCIALSGDDKIDADMDLKTVISNLVLKQDFLDSGEVVSYANGKDVSALIRNEVVNRNIGIVSDNIDVREFINSLLRQWSEEDSIIMDGRDIGTVVFPDADLKIYLDASVDIRALRRIKEYQEKGKNLDEKAIKNQIIQRDKEDRTRDYGALKKAHDARYLDTSGYNQTQVVHIIEEIIRELFN